MVEFQVDTAVVPHMRFGMKKLHVAADEKPVAMLNVHKLTQKRARGKGCGTAPSQPSVLPFPRSSKNPRAVQLTRTVTVTVTLETV